MNDEILIYAKCDTNKSIMKLVSSIFVDDTKDLVQIDKWQEGQDRYIYAHADNGEYVQNKHGKPLFDEHGRPNFHDNFIVWTEEEKQAKYPAPKQRPTPQEEQMEFNVDTDYRLSMLELGLV